MEYDQFGVPMPGKGASPGEKALAEEARQRRVFNRWNELLGQNTKK